MSPLVPKDWPNIPANWENGAIERVYFDRPTGVYKAEIYMDRSASQMPPVGWTTKSTLGNTIRYRVTVDITEAAYDEWIDAEKASEEKRQKRRQDREGK